MSWLDAIARALGSDLARRLEIAEQLRDQAIAERDQALRDRAALAMTLAFTPMADLT